MNKKKVFVLLAVALAVILAVGTYKFYPLVRLRAGLKALESKQIGLITRSAGFDKKKALARLPQSGLNGFVYRFDDRIGGAKVDGKAGSIPQSVLTRTVMGREARLLKLNVGELAETNNGVKFKYVAGQFLYNDLSSEPFGLDKRDFTKIIIRARHARGTGMTLFYNADLKNIETYGTDIDLVADGKFHDYIVGIEKLQGRTHLENIALKPSDVAGDEVEIASIIILSGKEEYLRKGVGAARIFRDGEQRPCLFIRGGMALRYIVDLPGTGDLDLRFGITSMEGDGPVEASVELASREAVRTLFKKKIGPRDGWEDLSIKIPDEARGRCEFIFRAGGGKDNLVFFSDPHLFGPVPRRMNVVWYLEDAERADHLSVYGYVRKTTPFKEELAKEGVVFLNAYSQGTMTGVSSPSFFTGMYPSATGVWDNSSAALAEEYMTAAEAMRSQGFETASFIQNYLAGPTMGLDRGFGSVVTMVGMPTSKTVDRALEWVEKNKGRNFFLYVHILDPHRPNDPQKPYDSWYRETKGVTRVKRDERFDPPWLKEPTVEGRIALYDGEIRANDDQFGRFVAGLKKAGVYDSTLLLFTADHGEFLGERGMWEHQPPCLRPVHHVPLMMIYPERVRGGARIKQNVQSIDIMPTVLEYAGVDASGFVLEGDSLVGLIEGRDTSFWEDRLIFADEVSTRKDKGDRASRGSAFYKDYMYVKSTANTQWLFDDGKEAGKRSGLYESFVVRMLSRSLDRMQKANYAVMDNITKGRKSEKKEDQEVREQLKALGYLQ